MKNLLSLILFTVILTVCLTAEEEKPDYVDVDTAKNMIVSLEREIEYHEIKISENESDLTALESAIEERSARLNQIESDLISTRESIKELNVLLKETEDRKTREEIEKTRSEILSVMWILDNERENLIARNQVDGDQVLFLQEDTERRRSVISSKQAEIPLLEESVKMTESKISEISSRLDAINSSLSEIRNSSE